MELQSNVVLIGFMGVGKGKTSRKLAELTGWYAVDSDDLIESFTNKKIRKIFKEDGESYFRSLESRTALWLAENVRKSIISTGGGFVNVPELRKIGTVTYLHSGFDEIVASIESHPNSEKKIKKRPLLRDMQAAKALYDARLPLYREVADIEVDVSCQTVSQNARQIAKRLGLLEL